jgi:hypothetical protein
VRKKEIWAVTTQHVLQNLALAVVLVCISVSVQVALSLLVVRLFQRLASFVEAHHNYLLIVSGFAALIITIMVGHIVQINTWGAFYLLSFFRDFWTALSLAAQTYTTLGYGDILLPAEHRMLEGWLALTGQLMIGWSTGLFAYLITKYYEARPAPIGVPTVTPDRQPGRC